MDNFQREKRKAQEAMSMKIALLESNGFEERDWGNYVHRTTGYFISMDTLWNVDLPFVRRLVEQTKL